MDYKEVGRRMRKIWGSRGIDIAGHDRVISLGSVGPHAVCVVIGGGNYAGCMVHQEGKGKLSSNWVQLEACKRAKYLGRFQPRRLANIENSIRWLANSVEGENKRLGL